MEIPFIGGSYEGRSTSINAQRSINLFPVLGGKDGKVPIAMYGTPGFSTFCTSGTSSDVRAMHIMGSNLYAVVGNTVYEINTSGTPTSLGTITTSSGHVGTACNGDELLIVDGTASGYIVSSSTLTQITGTDFVSSEDCVFFDGYFLAVQSDTGRFTISNLYDGTTWTSTDFATVESTTDDLVGIGTTKQNVWLFGERSTEVYYDSGNADFPFERVPGAITDIGCGAISSITEIGGVIYLLSHNGQVVRTRGYSLESVSTTNIDYQIGTYSTISDAYGLTYTLDGNVFYVLGFPTAGVTWVYSITHGEWHEWQSSNGSTQEYHRSRCGLLNGRKFNGKCLVGDRSTGLILELDMDTYTEGSNQIQRVRRTQCINKERYNVVHHRIEIEFEPGVGLNVAEGNDGYDPQASLSWSDDGGNTFNTPIAVSIGQYQERGTRAVWRRLGKSRNRVYNLTIESPVKVVLISAYSDLEALQA